MTRSRKHPFSLSKRQKPLCDSLTEGLFFSDSINCEQLYEKDKK